MWLGMGKKVEDCSENDVERIWEDQEKNELTVLEMDI